MRTLILIVACLGLAGCQDSPTPPRKLPKSEAAAAKATKADNAAPKAENETRKKPIPKGPRVVVANKRSECRRTLCIGGPGELDSKPNLDLGELCRRSPGVVQLCEGERCNSVWKVDDWQAGLDALVGTLDSSKDGTVDQRDRACEVSLAGWSTGAAVVARELPEALATRVGPTHARVENLVAMAPYAAGLDKLEIAGNVAKAFVYRHSEKANEDCSDAWEGGPWISPKPVCGEGTVCFDYDYSKQGNALAYFTRRGARAGREVGHCMVAAAVAKIGLDNLARGQEAIEETIPPYSNGRASGRPRPEGPPRPEGFGQHPDPGN